jgi:hypothetical protein
MTPRRYPPRSASTYDPATEMPRPVVGLDIDGTLGVYHDHFLAFAEGWLGRTLPRGYDGTVSLAKWCGVSKARYRQCKMAYRRGGLKRSMPVHEGAADLARSIRAAGGVVVICTTRPFLMLENVDPDTQEFLKRNRIQYDAIIHGEHKYRDLHRQYGSRVIMVLEDLPDLVVQAEFFDCRPVMILRPHNDGAHPSHAVSDLGMAKTVALQRIANYRKQGA